MKQTCVDPNMIFLLQSVNTTTISLAVCKYNNNLNNILAMMRSNMLSRGQQPTTSN